MRTIFLVLILFLTVGIYAQKGNPNSELATGYVHVKQIDGTWWFISPKGEKFISMGVNHVEPHLWLAPYNKEATLKRYGSDMVDERGFFNTDGKAAKKWIDQQLKTTADMNFNTWGRHTHPEIKGELYNSDIYYLTSLQTGPLAGWRERNGEGPRPDVFSSDFYNFLDDRVKSACALHRDNPNCLGYLYTDVPSWEKKNADFPAMKYPWLNAIIQLGETSPGKWAWLKHLQSRYNSAEEVAKVWGITTSSVYGISWTRLARQLNWNEPVDVKRASDDMKSFMPQIADQWYRLHFELIRKYDPNHLIFGDKNWIAWHYDYVLDALAKYVDVVSIQAYDRWVDDKKVCDKIYAVTGKPIFNGDGSHGFANEHQQEYGVKGWRTGTKNQKEVAALYKETVEEMMATPYVVGWHHCGFLEQWDGAERGDDPKNENGFMDPFENYYTEWTDVMKKVNARTVELHENAK